MKTFFSGRTLYRSIFIGGMIAVLFCSSTSAKGQKRKTEVIYGRKDGMALTMFVIEPPKSNNRGVVYVVSAGWRSGYKDIPYSIKDARPLWERGYTVFLVLHSSVPKYTIIDAVPDIRRAVRFVRYYARRYHIDPDHIGITGSSAGGHLSLMMATLPDAIDAADKDPVNHVSGRVQAAAVLYPPTDFLNYGQPNTNVFTDKATLSRNHRSAIFDFTEWNETEKKYTPISDSLRRLEILKQLSPIYEVSPDDPPVLIIHGDADQTVPLQQSVSFIAKLKQCHVPCELRIKKGADHGWDHDDLERIQFADWFDKYLK